MERRDFFRLGVRKTAEAAYTVASERAVRRAENWFRPPFATPEMDFLLDCTRCDKCIEACPHDVLFTLPVRYGAQVVGTPVMDLRKKGCHLCSDWPCVTACQTGALKIPEPDDDGAVAPPKLAVARIDEGTCLPYSGPECGACAASCPVPGALTWQGGVKPVIDQGLCTGCGRCRESCITEPKSIEIAVLVPPTEATNGETTGPV